MVGMTIDEILKDVEKVREELFSGKARNFKLGQHQSVFGGSGFEIKEIKKWEEGEPLDSIDWPLTLPHWPEELYEIKKVEIREVPLILALDVSKSLMISVDDKRNKFRLLIQVLVVLGFSSLVFRDRVGILCASDKIDFFLNPRLSKGQIYHAIELILEIQDEYEKNRIRSSRLRNLFNFFKKEGSSKPLNFLSETSNFLQGVVKHQSVIVFISDFMDIIDSTTSFNPEDLNTLMAGRNSQIIAIFLDEPEEFNWESGPGVVRVHDVETGVTTKVKASAGRRIRKEFVTRREVLREKLAKVGVDSTVISYGDHFQQLAQFLSERRTR